MTPVPSIRGDYKVTTELAQHQLTKLHLALCCVSISDSEGPIFNGSHYRGAMVATIEGYNFIPQWWSL